MSRIIISFLALVTAFSGQVQAQGEIAQNVFSQYRAEVDKATDAGLEYLKKNQQTEGHFPGRHGDSTGIVGLVGMAYLSKGHIPGFGPYGETIDRCIDYVLKYQQSNGLLDRRDTSGHGPMYAHNIATLFLSEVSGMVDPERQDKLDPVLAKATELILRAQAVSKSKAFVGGWRYKPDSRDSDLSCSGWALMSLRSAKLNGAPIPDEAIQSAVEYVFARHDKRLGTFGYTDTRGHADSLTGCGLLCLELCGYHGHESTYKAGEYILNNFRNLPRSSHEYYGNYYNAQGMFQLGGKYWEKYAEWMYTYYIPKQKPTGSWHSRSHGEIYGTAMMVLSFTVPYRQLPIYQRDETVDEES
tara:strand:+ start:7447 stop:8514 length:1068 start_codon:yes stop_codon:yes gene_type:complete